MTRIRNAAQFAARARECPGWSVDTSERNTYHIVTVKRGTEAFRFAWQIQEDGRSIFGSGQHRSGDEVEPWSNVSAALRLMSEPEENEAPGADIIDLAAWAGKRITWKRHKDGVTDSAHVPLNSPHTRITTEPDGAQILHFVDASGASGFRSVRIDNIKSARKSNRQTTRVINADSNKSSRGRRSRMQRTSRH